MPVITNGRVAVVAEDTETFGEALALQPIVQIPPYGPTMFAAPAVYMVDAEEFYGSLSATGAGRSVGGIMAEDFESECSPVLMLVSTPFTPLFHCQVLAPLTLLLQSDPLSFLDFLWALSLEPPFDFTSCTFGHAAGVTECGPCIYKRAFCTRSHQLPSAHQILYRYHMSVNPQAFVIDICQGKPKVPALHEKTC